MKAPHHSKGVSTYSITLSCSILDIDGAHQAGAITSGFLGPLYRGCRRLGIRRRRALRWWAFRKRCFHPVFSFSLRCCRLGQCSFFFWHNSPVEFRGCLVKDKDALAVYVHALQSLHGTPGRMTRSPSVIRVYICVARHTKLRLEVGFPSIYAARHQSLAFAKDNVDLSFHPDRKAVCIQGFRVYRVIGFKGYIVKD